MSSTRSRAASRRASIRTLEDDESEVERAAPRKRGRPSKAEMARRKKAAATETATKKQQKEEMHEEKAESSEEVKICFFF